MNRLAAELHRLYGNPSPAHGDEPAIRCIGIRSPRPAAWTALRPVWQGVQADLDWPAPAIVVDGVDAIELWFSLQQPVGEEQARMLGQTLCARFVADGAPERLQVRLQTADVDGGGMPPQERLPGQWSAFVAPDLAAVFANDPWLDMPPGDDAQAEQLARLRSVPPDALTPLLQGVPGKPPAPAAHGLPAASASRELATTVSHPVPATPGAFTWPSPGPQSARAFLQQVMNDAAVPLQWRVEAAKALLPHEVAERCGAPPASAS